MTHPYLGMDIAKDHIDIGIQSTGQSWQIRYTAEDLAALIEQIRPLDVVGIIIEASGGYEREAVATLATASLPVIVVNPRQVRDFAKAAGQLAKTDRIDALILSWFGEALKPPIRPLPDETTQALHALVRRRRQLVAMITAEKNRLATAPLLVVDGIRTLLAQLLQQRDDLDRELGRRLHESPIWREKEQLLRSITGIGPVTARTLLATVPELGTLSRQEAAALAGLAPVAHDSGTLRGKRSIRGGRAEVRMPLYMAAVSASRHNPVIRRVYERLIAKGKPPKVALTACMRKLLLICNAILHSNVPWDPAYRSRPAA